VAQEAKTARCNYKQVRYSHVPIGPDELAVLTADPWSFMHGYLLDKASKTAAANRKGFERATYFAKLAEDFYRSSEAVNLPTKGTLLYYGMMNLVKAYLAVNKIPLEEIQEHHGITNTHGRKHSLTISGNIKGCTNIFLEFARLLGTPVSGKHEINLRHVFPHIPELHAIVTETSLLKNSRMLPVNIAFLVNPENTYLFTEISYDKSADYLVDTSKFYRSKRKEYFGEPANSDSKVVHRSLKRKKITKENWPRIYKNILREYQAFSLASMLTRNGYRYYCELQEPQYHHLCNAYLLMFYIGHSARYRPAEINEILTGNMRPLVTEAIALCPPQFLYQLVSLITNKLCVIPYARI
jgi:hypothetical protein